MTDAFLEFDEDGKLPSTGSRDSTSVDMDGIMNSQKQSKSSIPTAQGFNDDDLDTDDAKAEVSGIIHVNVLNLLS